MKTTNKIQKTALTAALAVGFSILGFSIDAQIENKLLPENNSANNLAMVSEKNVDHFNKSSNLTSESTFATYLEKETESAMDLEKWMLDDSNFSFAISVEAEIETPMQIEDWMINEKTFNVNSVTIETATDERIELEDWMLEENKFEAKNHDERNASVQTEKYIYINNICFPAVITEKNLQLEDWMTDPKIWE